MRNKIYKNRGKSYSFNTQSLGFLEKNQLHQQKFNFLKGKKLIKKDLSIASTWSTNSYIHARKFDKSKRSVLLLKGTSI